MPVCAYYALAPQGKTSEVKSSLINSLNHPPLQNQFWPTNIEQIHHTITFTQIIKESFCSPLSIIICGYHYIDYSYSSQVYA